MIPLEKLDQVTTPDGEELSLHRRGDAYYIRVAGRELMTSRTHGSEQDVARLAHGALAGRPRPRVLVGGLGMGYTLRAALDCFVDGVVTVAELIPRVVEWNRSWLAALAGHPLDDPRVRLAQADVFSLLEPGAFDAVLLDVDDGPASLTIESNDRLYTRDGLDRLRATVGKGGVIAVWSDGADDKFVDRLRKAGFDARCAQVRAQSGKGVRYFVFVAVAR